jgi:hypothetical protein
VTGTSEEGGKVAAENAQRIAIVSMFKKGTWYELDNVRVMTKSKTNELELVYEIKDAQTLEKSKRE